MTLEAFNNLTGSLESLATIAALSVGAYWTYQRFIKQRENFAFIEFTVDIAFVGRQGDWWIVELLANLENKGKVQHRFSDLSFDLASLSIGEGLERSDEFNGQACFPGTVAKGPWIPTGSYFIEPGIKAMYTYVARVPANAAFLMLHGNFTYTDQQARHSAEKTVKMPSESGST